MALGGGVAGLAAGDEVAAHLPDGGGHAEYATTPEPFVCPPAELGLDLRTAGATPLVLPPPAGRWHVRPGSRRSHGPRPRGGGAARPVVGGGGGVRHGEHKGEGGVREPLRLRLGLPAGRLPVRGTGDDVRPGRGPHPGPDRRPHPPGELRGAGPPRPGRALRRVGPPPPIWTNNRALTGYSIGDLSRRAPETLRRHALAALGLVASGAVRIDITAEYDLAEAPEAQRLLEAGENTGKAVLRVRR
ncbi:zinc-binding dehydrogenase [Streptomyces microflavus]|uniref:zinc-binding dehydrogenase n=1 Tax=Streptomyces microflavus TaxID=1919 RepID=UPI003680DEE0